MRHEKTTKEEKAEVRHKWRKKRRLEQLEIINRLKTRPCMDCKIQFNPWVMHFDHRPGTIKRFNVSSAIGSGSNSIRSIQKEIDKCDIVCANCHANRTYKRLKER